MRYVGFSNFDEKPELARRAVAIQQRERQHRFISSQPRYNLIDRHVEKGHAEFCRRNGIGLVVYSPLSQGVLTNKYAAGARPEGSRATGPFAHFLDSQKALTPENVAAAERLAAWCGKRDLEPAAVAIAWVLRNPAVASAIVGATSVTQLEQNAKALEVKLSDADWREVSALTLPKAASAKKKSRAPRAALARGSRSAGARPRPGRAAAARASRAGRRGSPA